MAYTRSEKLICPDIGSGTDCWMQGAIDVTGADKVGDKDTYVVTVDTNVWMHWVETYGLSTLKLLVGGTPTQLILNDTAIFPVDYTGYPEINSYANRSGWIRGGVFSYEIPKTAVDQDYTFTLQFYNGYCSPSSRTVSKTITVPKKASSVHVKVDGAWKEGLPYVKVNGVWKEGIIYTKVNDTWKEGV